MTEETAAARLAPLLERAGIPLEEQGDVVESLGAFTTAMSLLLRANEEHAPNYITFALSTPEGDRYELTIRKSEGKTPCEIISELESRIEVLSDALQKIKFDGRLARDQVYGVACKALGLDAQAVASLEAAGRMP